MNDTYLALNPQLRRGNLLSVLSVNSRSALFQGMDCDLRWTLSAWSAASERVATGR